MSSETEEKTTSPDTDKSVGDTGDVSEDLHPLSARIIAYLRDHSEPIIASSAIVAVIISAVSLWQSAAANLESSRLQVAVASQQAIEHLTQVAQAEEGLTYDGASAAAAQTAVALQDRQLQERSDRSPSPTAPPATVVATPDPTANAEIALQLAGETAETAVHEYFQLINLNRYAEAWSRLTSQFQLIFSENSFKHYRGFWETVDEVLVLEAASQSVDPGLTRASLIVTVRYFEAGYDWDRTYTYTLERQSPEGQWKIADTRLIGE